MFPASLKDYYYQHQGLFSIFNHNLNQRVCHIIDCATAVQYSLTHLPDYIISKLIKNDIKIFSLNLLPRITRAQSMDVLSSQSNLAGYRAVIDCVTEFEKAVPMMMTAAGTVPAAKVLIIGAGVAGLQAIATAKRLGAIVSATDVRAASKEQVESLGGKFLTVEQSENMETAGGYAKEASEEYKNKQDSSYNIKLKLI